MDILNAIKYFIIGIIQGITEVLPISSSGHVEIFQRILNLDMSEKSYLFLILVNTGSLVTFVVIYFKRLVELIKSFFVYIFVKKARTDNHDNFIYMSKILIASIPAGVVGIFLKNTIDDALSSYSLLFVGIGLIFTATVLLYISRRKFHNHKSEITWRDSIIIGVAQSVAIIPGVSRSGMTTSAAIERDHGIDSALNFSFLLYIPISVASLLLMIYEAFNEGLAATGTWDYINYILAFIGAAIATYIAYKLIFSIFKSGKIRYFGYYCLVLGLGSMFWYIFN